MQRLISLWKKESNKGTTYYTGKLGELGLIGFDNDNKTNDKQPDLIIYIKEEPKKEDKKSTSIKAEQIDDPYANFGEQLEINDNFLE